MKLLERCTHLINNGGVSDVVEMNRLKHNILTDALVDLDARSKSLSMSYASDLYEKVKGYMIKKGYSQNKATGLAELQLSSRKEEIKAIKVSVRRMEQYREDLQGTAITYMHQDKNNSDQLNVKKDYLSDIK